MGTLAHVEGSTRPFLIAAWHGNEDARAALNGGVPCGCDRIAAADDIEPGDPSSAAMERRAGEAHAAEWGCPAMGYTPPRELSDACRDSLTAIENVCGASGMETCPNFYTRLPWVSRALALYRGRKLGIARALEPSPSATMCEAMLVLDGAVAARRDHEWKKAEDERKRKDAEAGRT